MFSEIRAIRRECRQVQKEGNGVIHRFHAQNCIEFDLYLSLAHLEALQKNWQDYGMKRLKRPLRWMVFHSRIKQVNRLRQEIITYTNADVNARVNVLIFADGVNRIRKECNYNDLSKWNCELDRVQERFENAERLIKDTVIKYSTMIASGKLTERAFRHSVQMNREILDIEEQYPLIRKDLYEIFEKYCPDKTIPFPELFHLEFE